VLDLGGEASLSTIPSGNNEFVLLFFGGKQKPGRKKHLKAARDEKKEIRVSGSAYDHSLAQSLYTTIELGGGIEGKTRKRKARNGVYQSHTRAKGGSAWSFVGRGLTLLC